MDKKSPLKTGEGWAIYQDGGNVWIKFNHKPDGRTIVKLRRIATWFSTEKAWRANADHLNTLHDIGTSAETWESVGEEPPSWFSDDDYPIFH